MLRKLVTVGTRSNMAFTCPPELLLRNALRQSASRLANRPVSSATYKACVCTELNKPMQIVDMPRESSLPDGYVRIAIHSAAVNFGDILVTQGKYQEKPDLPFVVGNELAGEVLEVGPEVTRFVPGDRVFGSTGQMTGAFAEEGVVPEFALHKLAPEVSYDSAASFMVAYGTAYMALKYHARIREGETVLVTAAAGAVGMAAVDLAANVFKCNVIGACGDASKCETVKAKGASACVVYTKERLRDRVKELTEGKGADIIFDAVGGKVFDECVRCVAFEGRLLIIGFASGEIPRIPANLLLVKSCSAVGVYWGSYSFRKPEVYQESVRESAALMARGLVQPEVAAAYPLSKANEAFQFIMARKNIGKVIIHPREQ